MEEKEVKFLDIDSQEIEEKLESIGAEKVFDKLYKRRVFDYPDLRLNEKAAWLRLRDEGDKVTLTFKQRIGVKKNDGTANDKTMKEIEIVVSDFDETAQLLEEIGLKEKFYEENRRTRYLLGDVEFDIDLWPQLDPYLEIEAPSWKEVEEAIHKLGLDPDDKKIFSTYQIYQLKGIDEHDYKEITFEKMAEDRGEISSLLT